MACMGGSAYPSASGAMRFYTYFELPVLSPRGNVQPCCPHMSCGSWLSWSAGWHVSFLPALPRSSRSRFLRLVLAVTRLSLCESRNVAVARFIRSLVQRSCFRAVRFRVIEHLDRDRLALSEVAFLPRFFSRFVCVSRGRASLIACHFDIACLYALLFFSFLLFLSVPLISCVLTDFLLLHLSSNVPILLH